MVNFESGIIKGVRCLIKEETKLFVQTDFFISESFADFFKRRKLSVRTSFYKLQRFVRNACSFSETALRLVLVTPYKTYTLHGLIIIDVIYYVNFFSHKNELFLSLQQLFYCQSPLKSVILISVKSHFINGRWIDGTGLKFSSTDSVTGEILWQGREATLQETDLAIYAARQAFEKWCETSLTERIGYLTTFQKLLEENKSDLALTISKEVGKPLWESLTEVQAMVNKIAISITAYRERSTDKIEETGSETHATRFKPHGVVAVFGPYNFPGHLANGHIVPALLAGNTVIFKQSEMTPLVGQKTVELWEQSGIPAGVLNLVQGGRTTGQALASHPGLDGLFFTGSSQIGLVLNKQFAEHPEKILALEMGGNNPLIAHKIPDLKAAAYHTILSAYLTSGQRCTCARRLIVIKDAEGDAFLNELKTMAAKIHVGHYSEKPEPFMGPVITPGIAELLIKEQDDLLQNGATPLLEMKLIKPGTGLLSPGILDVTQAKNRGDKEFFGPLLQVIRVSNFDEAIDEANNTNYGLAAGLFSSDRELYKKFYRKIEAGIVNWNKQLTGASSKAPFGGIGLSGNHRPSAYFAADYCAYPVASMESASLEMPKSLISGITP